MVVVVSACASHNERQAEVVSLAAIGAPSTARTSRTRRGGRPVLLLTLFLTVALSFEPRYFFVAPPCEAVVIIGVRIILSH